LLPKYPNVDERRAADACLWLRRRIKRADGCRADPHLATTVALNPTSVSRVVGGRPRLRKLAPSGWSGEAFAAPIVRSHEAFDAFGAIVDAVMTPAESR